MPSAAKAAIEKEALSARLKSCPDTSPVFPSVFPQPVKPEILHWTAKAVPPLQFRGGSAIDARTTRHAGYRISQKKRKRIEECFGWLKTIALLRKVRHRGLLKVDWVFTFACAAYNLVRLRNLSVQPA